MWPVLMDGSSSPYRRAETTPLGGGKESEMPAVDTFSAENDLMPAVIAITPLLPRCAGRNVTASHDSSLGEMRTKAKSLNRFGRGSCEDDCLLLESCLNFKLDVDGFANQHAARLERSIPLDTEVFTVDCGGR